MAGAQRWHKRSGSSRATRRLRAKRWRATRRSRAHRASQITGTITYLTAADPALQRLIEATPLGMAHWSGTGPPGTVCEQCSFYGYGAHPNSCYRIYVRVMEHGSAFPAETRSCKHFAPR